MSGEKSYSTRGTWHHRMELESDSRVAVIGGGPAGALFSYFLLEQSRRAGLDRLAVDIYEPRDFGLIGPGGCNMCGGVISESLVLALAAEGIHLPSSVIQRTIDSYVLHLKEGSVLIKMPAREKRIAAVFRGAGPRGMHVGGTQSFDAFLLELAMSRGARWLRTRVDQVAEHEECLQLQPRGGDPQNYDLIAVATGVNTAAKFLEPLGLPYGPPRTTKTFVCELELGQAQVDEHFGRAMHIFVLDFPRLEFAALIPKGEYVTLCLMGREIDQALVTAFLQLPQVRSCLSPDWQMFSNRCHCSPRINIGAATHPFADRIVFVGDCGVTRLYKDGLGAAYRTAKAAATTAVQKGISAEVFRQHYFPVCNALERDNLAGQIMFAIIGIQKRIPHDTRGILRMVGQELEHPGRMGRMSSVMWDLFTGSAPYQKILLRTLHPAFLGRLLWNILAGFLAVRSETL